MSLETLELIILKALNSAKGYCTFAFQGGEPTLAGLPFYREFVRLVKRHNARKLDVNFVIQTNGYAIDGKWARFLSGNGFLVGLSLDGCEETHDKYRIDTSAKGTYSKVIKAAKLFDAFKVKYNILTTVTTEVAKNIEAVYNFYSDNHFKWQQYNACIDPIGDAHGRHGFSITPEHFGNFLKRLFDLWYADLMDGTPVSIQYFDNLVLLLLRRPMGVCGMLGHCTCQYVFEADGGAYPCDFYVLDEYRLGSISEHDFSDFDNKRKEIGFIEKSIKAHADCRKCRWFFLCRGGCRRYRDEFNGNPLHKNVLCDAYKDFFEYAAQRLYEVAKTAAYQEMSVKLGHS